MSRAENAEIEVKEVKSELSKQEATIHNLNNKVTLLQGDVERAEKRVKDVNLNSRQNKAKKQENDHDASAVETLRRKVDMLEQQVDSKEQERKAAVEKYNYF